MIYVCALIILCTIVCRQHCDADSCRYYRQNITSGLGLFSLVYGVWFKVATRQRPCSGKWGARGSSWESTSVCFLKNREPDTGCV